MEKQTFNLVISKVNQLLFSGEAYSVNLPGVEGQFTVLPHHEPLISILAKGTIKIDTAEKRREFDVKKGICEVHKNTVTVLI